MAFGYCSKERHQAGNTVGCRELVYRTSADCLSMQMLLVFSLDKPPWDGQMATRFLVSAEASGLAVTVLLNKADLVTKERRLQVQEQVYLTRCLQQPPMPLHNAFQCVCQLLPKLRADFAMQILQRNHFPMLVIKNQVRRGC